MPDTDITALLAQIPELDKAVLRKDPKKPDDPPKLDRTNEGKFTGPSWEEAKKVFDPILAGGRDAIAGVLAMVNEKDDGSDYRARYVIHGLGLYTFGPEKAKERAALREALLAQVGQGPKPVQAFAIQELRDFGNKDATPALGKLLTDDELGAPAAAALTAIKAGAVEQFREALPKASGRRRMAIVQALGVLKDAASVPALQQAVSDTDLDTRLAAVWGLAHIGDGGSVQQVLKVADAGGGWERIQGTKCAMLLAENLLAAGKKDEACRIYSHLEKTRTDPSEKYVRDAAAKALAAAK